MKGLIFNIQRYSIHDGEGIRTLVFLKGCPLRCPWCCNPESQSFQIEKAIIKPHCIHCKQCSHTIENCPSGAITEFGEYMSSEDVVREVMKDSIFYNTSGGGVTLSGGEVLSQPAFVLEILINLKKVGIHTAIETCGMGNKEDLKEIAQYLDCILFDLKIMDEKKAKEVLNADIQIIMENMRLLVKMHKKVIPRVPLIPGYTMDDQNINKIIQFIKELCLKEVHLLPFHQYGSNKYEYIDKTYTLRDILPPDPVEVEGIRVKMEEAGLKVVVGGM